MATATPTIAPGVRAELVSLRADDDIITSVAQNLYPDAGAEFSAEQKRVALATWHSIVDGIVNDVADPFLTES